MESIEGPKKSIFFLGRCAVPESSLIEMLRVFFSPFFSFLLSSGLPREAPKVWISLVENDEEIAGNAIFVYKLVWSSVLFHTSAEEHHATGISVDVRVGKCDSSTTRDLDPQTVPFPVAKGTRKRPAVSVLIQRRCFIPGLSCETWNISRLKNLIISWANDHMIFWTNSKSLLGA